MTIPAENSSERVRDFMQLWAEAVGMVLSQIATAPCSVAQTAGPREPSPRFPVTST